MKRRGDLGQADSRPSISGASSSCTFVTSSDMAETERAPEQRDRRLERIRLHLLK